MVEFIKKNSLAEGQSKYKIQEMGGISWFWKLNCYICTYIIQFYILENFEKLTYLPLGYFLKIILMWQRICISLNNIQETFQEVLHVLINIILYFYLFIF